VSWIPRREIYCSVCRRMVEATTSTITGPGVLVPGDHYRFASSPVTSMANLRGTMAYRCSGSGHLYAGEPGMDHGREDRLAAWRTSLADPTRYQDRNPLKFWKAKT